MEEGKKVINMQCKDYNEYSSIRCLKQKYYIKIIQIN